MSSVPSDGSSGIQWHEDTILRVMHEDMSAEVRLLTRSMKAGRRSHLNANTDHAALHRYHRDQDWHSIFAPRRGADLLATEPARWKAGSEQWMEFDRAAFSRPEVGRCVFLTLNLPFFTGARCLYETAGFRAVRRRLGPAQPKSRDMKNDRTRQV